MSSNNQKLIIFTDGGARSNPGPAGIGVVVMTEDGSVVAEIKRYIGEATNNDAEYQALLESLTWLTEYENSKQITHVSWKLDSKLVVEQILRHWRIKEARLQTYATKAWQLLDSLSCSYSFTHVPRAQNAHADALVNAAVDEALV